MTSEPRAIARTTSEEPDRGTVRVNGIVVDVIGNPDGSVYVEFYAYDGRGKTVAMRERHAGVGGYRNPSALLRLRDRDGQGRTTPMEDGEGQA